MKVAAATGQAPAVGLDSVLISIVAITIGQGRVL